MAPHTAWEWLERYGSIQLDEGQKEMEFEELRETVTRDVEKMEAFLQMEPLLKATKKMAKTAADVVQEGSSFGALRAKERAINQERPLSEHLSFSVRETEKIWQDYLETGILREPDPQEVPPAFVNSEKMFQMIQKTAGENGGWYAHYQLGILLMQKKAYEEAGRELEASICAAEQPWACHGLAALLVLEGREEEAARMMEKGILLRKDDLGYVKEGFQILLTCQAYEILKGIYEELEDGLKENGRLKFGYIRSLFQMGETERAEELLEEGGGLIVEDIREGESGLGAIWRELQNAKGIKDAPVPYRFDFESI
nr:hypothetical protein [uncultured Merdimonas sp.]